MEVCYNGGEIKKSALVQGRLVDKMGRNIEHFINISKNIVRTPRPPLMAAYVEDEGLEREGIRTIFVPALNGVEEEPLPDLVVQRGELVPVHRIDVVGGPGHVRLFRPAIREWFKLGALRCVVDREAYLVVPCRARSAVAEDVHVGLINTHAETIEGTDGLQVALITR